MPTDSWRSRLPRTTFSRSITSAVEGRLNTVHSEQPGIAFQKLQIAALNAIHVPLTQVAAQAKYASTFRASPRTKTHNCTSQLLLTLTCHRDHPATPSNNSVE